MPVLKPAFLFSDAPAACNEIHSLSFLVDIDGFPGWFEVIIRNRNKRKKNFYIAL